MTRVREVRSRLVREGPSRTRDHERDFETVTLPERDCDLLRDLLIAEGAATVVEVGLAYASSALAIGEALVTIDFNRLLGCLYHCLQTGQHYDEATAFPRQVATPAA